MCKETLWEEIRKRYESGQGSGRALAREFGLPSREVYKRAAEEGWKGYRPRLRMDARLDHITQQLLRVAKAAADELEQGEADMKTLKELAGVVHTLAGLDRTLRRDSDGGTEAVEVVMGEEAEKFSG